MIGWRVREDGGGWQAERREAAVGAPPHGRVRVRVEAFAIGPGEWAGAREAGEAAGADGCGVVLDAGGASWPPVGEAVVFPAVPAPCRATGRGLRPVDPGPAGWFGEEARGTWAQEVLLPPEVLLRRPAGCSAAEAAAALAHPRVSESLRTSGLEAGDWLAVFAAGAEDGPAAVAAGHRLGARVLAVCDSVEHVARLRTLGADEVFAEPVEDVPLRLRKATAKHGVEVLWGPASAVLAHRPMDWLSPGARWLCSAPCDAPAEGPAIGALLGRLASVSVPRVPEFARSARLLEHVDAGAFPPALDRRYPAERAGRALRRLGESGRFGKVVIELSGDEAAG